MLAPVDARAEVAAGDDKVVLQLNFRTLALAKAKGVNLLSGADMTKMDALDLATIVAAFAEPDQPGFGEEQAFALLTRHGDATRGAINALFRDFSAAAGIGGAEATAEPRPRSRRKATA